MCRGIQAGGGGGGGVGGHRGMYIRFFFFWGGGLRGFRVSLGSLSLPPSSSFSLFDSISFSLWVLGFSPPALPVCPSHALFAAFGGW